MSARNTHCKETNTLQLSRAQRIAGAVILSLFMIDKKSVYILFGASMSRSHTQACYTFMLPDTDRLT